jgi:hypothetical protein
MIFITSVTMSASVLNRADADAAEERCAWPTFSDDGLRQNAHAGSRAFG